MNPLLAALLRSVGIGVLGAILTFLVGFFNAYETPAGASSWFVALVLVLRFAAEGAYDAYRKSQGG